jgi:hypothetical protein
MYEGLRAHSAKTSGMARDLASMLLRRSIRRTADDLVRCHDCRRTPLTGELLHAIQGERVLCSLCLARVPEQERAELSTRRVHASERPLAVVRQAA